MGSWALGVMISSRLCHFWISPRRIFWNRESWFTPRRSCPEIKTGCRLCRIWLSQMTFWRLITFLSQKMKKLIFRTSQMGVTKGQIWQPRKAEAMMQCEQQIWVMVSKCRLSMEMRRLRLRSKAHWIYSTFLAEVLSALKTLKFTLTVPKLTAVRHISMAMKWSTLINL